MAIDLPLFLSLALSKMTSHVLGSSVQIPEGQSEAPSAEHCPSQLTPWPQVTTLGVLSGVQQVTLLTLLENVKALSKKSTDGVFEVVSPRNYDQIKSSFAQSLPKIRMIILQCVSSDQVWP